MEYVLFGRTGLVVSQLGLGGAPIGGDFGQTDDTEIERLIHEAIDGGINFIDTAPLYGKGKSEERIGRALEGGKRNSVVIASKAVRSDLSYDYDATLASVEDSLRRLRTDRIDIMQIHDAETQPYELLIEETLPALIRLKEEGKIRYIGATSRNLSTLQSLMHTGELDTIQFYARYMLIDCTAVEEILPLASLSGVGVINGSVLGMGLLAGSPAPFLGKDLIRRAEDRLMRLSFLDMPGKKEIVETAMRFSLSNPNVHVTLTGVSSLPTLRSNMKLCDGNRLADWEIERIHEWFGSGEGLFD